MLVSNFSFRDAKHLPCTDHPFPGELPESIALYNKAPDTASIPGGRALIWIHPIYALVRKVEYVVENKKKKDTNIIKPP